MSPPRATPLALLAAALAATSGCGGDSGGKVTRGRDTVAMTEYEFIPRDVTARSGAVLKVVNDGQIAHNLTVKRSASSKGALTGTDTFLAGGSKLLKVDLAPGRYAIVCTVPGHEKLGMVGTLRVRRAAGGGNASP
jgi:plastocyanin